MSPLPDLASVNKEPSKPGNPAFVWQNLKPEPETLQLFVAGHKSSFWKTARRRWDAREHHIHPVLRAEKQLTVGVIEWYREESIRFAVRRGRFSPNTIPWQSYSRVWGSKWRSLLSNRIKEKWRWKGPTRPSSPTPCSRQESKSKQICQVIIQVFLEGLQCWSTH